VDVEAALARHTVRRAIWVGPVVVLLFWLIRGPEGALGSTVGVLAVVANFLLSGWGLSVAARISPGAYHAAALFGFVVRFALLTATIVITLALVPDLDRIAFAISTVATYLVLLTWETVMVSKGAERELEWMS
jgi:hypothetical protein